ncbi:MAG: hypothetical protein K1X67_01215 [Fimbriimonadaceae bacterium]|nr:hypothetical protein [Fimbriimonadaceae bacterium]
MKAFYGVVALIFVGAVVAAYGLAGEPGLIGMVCGLVATTFNLWALWLMIRLAGKFVKPDPGDEPSPARINRGAIIVVTAFFIKLPVFAAFAWVAQRAGEAALTAFAIGILLVYSAMVGWAQGRSPGPL